MTELTAARDDLMSAQDVHLRTGMRQPRANPSPRLPSMPTSARSRTSSPIWGLAAAIPVLGATPEAVRAITTALDQAVGAMVPAVEAIVGLRSADLVG